MWSLLIGYDYYIRIFPLSNAFVQSINFAEYEDTTRLESHKEKVQESFLKITKEVKNSKEKAQEKQKLQHDKKISKRKLEDIYLNEYQYQYQQYKYQCISRPSKELKVAC